MSGGGGGGGVGSAALRAAAGAGDVAACARLLGSARSVRFSKDELGRSALHLAGSAGHAPVVRLLLSVAAPREVDAPDGSGCTALQRCAADGHEEVARLLLARGADVDRRDAVHGNCALHEAAWKGYSRTVALLATAGADLGRANAGGFTALHLCCQNGHNQSCRELLLAGCDPDLQNNYGDTALHTAARYGHAGVTRILISAKCRVSEQNKNGDTAVHIAAAMGRRKLTRILLEAGCDRTVRNKQNETARDIALRKDLNEILNILDDALTTTATAATSSMSKRDKKSSKSSKKQPSPTKTTKVRFDGATTASKPSASTSKPSNSSNNPSSNNPSSNNPSSGNKNWSPYGCHYYPDPEAFPSPRLDTLPAEPLKRGEQYYLDLAGNICKGPVGVGYTCYCAPLFRHLEARLEKDKRELQKAQLRLGQKVAGLEQRLNRGAHARRSERAPPATAQFATLARSRSLEMLDKVDENPLQATRSMDELENANEEDHDASRPSVKELVARIQHRQRGSRMNSSNRDGENSESSDDEDRPLRMLQHGGTMGDSNLYVPPGNDAGTSNYENVPGDIPRSRMGVYSPTSINRTGSDMALVDPKSSYVEPNVRIQESNVLRSASNQRIYTTSAQIPIHSKSYEKKIFEKNFDPDSKFYEQSMNLRFAKLRLLDNAKAFEGSSIGNVGETSCALSSDRLFENATRMLENPHDAIDRDTNNDSGYSTKVYGSSKGNSPCLSGQTDEGLGTSSLV